jgi:hypothetical protein
LYKKIRNHFKTEESKKKIRYYFVNSRYKVGDFIKDCIEIDLKSAYWESANNMGLLSKGLYTQGKSVSKQSRLAAIGSLARVKNRIAFDGYKETKLPPIRNELTEFLWDTICHKIGKLMHKTGRECGKDFIFVWVDAMFVHKTAVKKIEKMMKAAGFEVSIEKCDWIQFNASNITVKGKGKWVSIDGKWIWKDTREFPFSVGSGMDKNKVEDIIVKYS